MNYKKKALTGAVAALIVLTCGSLIFTLTTLVSGAVCEANGFDPSAFSLVFSALSAGPILTNMVIGPLIEKLGMKKLSLISAVTPVIYFLCLGLVKNIILLCVIAFVCGVTYTCSYVASYNVYVSAWFNKGKGLLISLASAVPALVVMVLSPVFASIVESAGVTAACIGFGVGTSAISLLASLLICEMPQAYGAQKVDLGKGKAEKDAAQEGTAPAKKEDLVIPASRLVRHPVGLLALLCPVFVALGGTMYATYAPSILQSFGLDYLQASYYFSACNIGVLILSLLLGVLADKLGAKKVVLAYSLLGGIGMIASALLSGQAGALIFVLFYGCNTCFAIIAGFLFPQLFGQKASMSFIGWGNMVVCLITIFAAPVAMGVYNAAGQSYQALLYVCGALFLLTFAINAYMMNPKREQQVQKLDKKYRESHPANG